MIGDPPEDDEEEFFDGDPEDLPDDDDQPIEAEILPAKTNQATTIASLLDIEPPRSIAAITEADDQLSDIDFARKKIRETIALGEGALKEMLDLAQSSQHPRSFEVAVQMFGSLVDANKKLLETVHVDKKTKLEGLPKGGPDVNTPHAIANHTTNNVVMVGSTADAIELVRRKREAAKARIIDNAEEAP